jgi:hypothetical protein
MLASLRTLNGTIAILAVVTSLLVGLLLGGGPSLITGWLRQFRSSPAISVPNEATPTAKPPTETATIEPSATSRATNTPKATATEAATETPEATPTEAATETPEATLTRRATRTPRATRTERPTETAEAEVTERPSEEAEATETPSAEVQAILDNGGVLLEIIANGNVNIRQEPSIDGTILRSLASGTQAEVIGRTEDNSWVQIRLLDDEVEGWMTNNSDLVEITGDIESLPITSEEADSEG